MRRLLVVAVGVLCCALPASAYGQASRTWVSGVGDDANPCSRTAPCKTFAGAISKTAAGGEIDVLDPAGLGAVTITKSITLDGGGTFGGITGPSASGVTINTPANSRVTIRNLSITGGPPSSSGLRGINVPVGGASNVRVENVRISGFTTCGICLASTDAASRLTVVDSVLADNAGPGILASPRTSGPTQGGNRVTVRDSELYGNGAGVATTATPGPYRIGLLLFDNLISDNLGTGVLTDGLVNARIGGNSIIGNERGLQPDNGSQILSFGDNRITGNQVDGVPTGSLAPN